MKITINTEDLEWCLGTFADGKELVTTCKECQKWSEVKVREFYGRYTRIRRRNECRLA